MYVTASMQREAFGERIMENSEEKRVAALLSVPSFLRSFSIDFVPVITQGKSGHLSNCLSLSVSQSQVDICVGLTVAL